MAEEATVPALNVIIVSSAFAAIFLCRFSPLVPVIAIKRIPHVWYENTTQKGFLHACKNPNFVL